MDISTYMLTFAVNTGSLRMRRPADVALPGGLIFQSLYRFSWSDRASKIGQQFFVLAVRPYPKPNDDSFFQHAQSLPEVVPLGDAPVRSFCSRFSLSPTGS
jgi:hypothetical protein